MGLSGDFRCYPVIEPSPNMWQSPGMFFRAYQLYGSETVLG